MIEIGGERYELVNMSDAIPSGCLVLKPVKKTEKKYNFSIEFKEIANTNNLDIGYMWAGLVDKDTANKLSEAISALVEYVQGNKLHPEHKYIEARQSFQESQ